MGVIRYKIWRDLWANRSRTLQVVLIIAMGAFAIGSIIGSSSLMREVGGRGVVAILGIMGSIALSGVMRATGAVSRTISGLFIGEGLILGWLSWLIALPLSIPAGYLMVQALAAAIQGEIVYNYTPGGALYWLGIVTVLSVVASWFPAHGATRIIVRESLAYQ